MIEKEVALVVAHERVEGVPSSTEVGVAVREQVGSGGGTTVTVVEHVTDPPAPVAVPV